MIQHHARDIADEVLLSCDVGIAKPDPQIYRLALRRVAVAARDALFIDDDAAHVAVARELGMTGHVHRSTLDTIAAIERWRSDSMPPIEICERLVMPDRGTRSCPQGLSATTPTFRGSSEPPPENSRMVRMGEQLTTAMVDGSWQPNRRRRRHHLGLREQPRFARSHEALGAGTDVHRAVRPRKPPTNSRTVATDS